MDMNTNSNTIWYGLKWACKPGGPTGDHQYIDVIVSAYIAYRHRRYGDLGVPDPATLDKCQSETVPNNMRCVIDDDCDCVECLADKAFDTDIDE